MVKCGDVDNHFFFLILKVSLSTTYLSPTQDKYMEEKERMKSMDSITCGNQQPPNIFFLFTASALSHVHIV